METSIGWRWALRGNWYGTDTMIRKDRRLTLTHETRTTGKHPSTLYCVHWSNSYVLSIRLFEILKSFVYQLVFLWTGMNVIALLLTGIKIIILNKIDCIMNGIFVHEIVNFCTFLFNNRAILGIRRIIWLYWVLALDKRFFWK